MFLNYSQLYSKSNFSSTSSSEPVSSIASIQHDEPLLNISKSKTEKSESEHDMIYPEDDLFVSPQEKKMISVGDFLPYGPKLFYENSDTILRMKDIGEKNRIILIGVTGSFTPDCWNRHLFGVIKKLRYYEERQIDYICCLSTNDAFTQQAWSIYLGCDERILMLSDVTTRYTRALGMDIVVPLLDNHIRSRRYVIYAEDMLVIKMIVAPFDGPSLKWQCEHLAEEIPEEEEEETDETEEFIQDWI